MTVVQYDTPAPLPASQPGDELDTGPRGWVARLRAAAEYAAYISDTDFVPTQVRGNPAAITATILYGDELGLTPMQSLAKIANVKGRPALYAETARALVLSAGHELWLEESTTTRAIAAGRRHGSERIGRVTWTMDDAKRAGLANQPSYRSYPREMLVARATGTLAKQMFADVLGGLAVAEDLDGQPDNPPPATTIPEPPPDIKPEPAKTTRRRSRAPLAPAPPPDTQPEPDPEPPAEPASDAQLRRMFALFREQEIDDRASRLAYTQQVLGRSIDSSKELTKDDASKVIDALQPAPVFRVPDGVQLPPDQQAVVDEIKRDLEAVPDEPEE